MYEYHTNRRSQRDLYTRIVDRQPSSPLTIGALLNSSLAMNLWPRGRMAHSLSLSLTNLPPSFSSPLEMEEQWVGGEWGENKKRHLCGHWVPAPLFFYIDRLDKKGARDNIAAEKNYNITFFFCIFAFLPFFRKVLIAYVDRAIRQSPNSSARCR